MSKSPKTITASEQELLLNWLWPNKFGTIRDAVPCRNYTMTLFMLFAGLRVGEMVQLTISDLWFENEPKKSLVARAEITKNKKERTIPLCQKIIDAVWELKHHWFANPTGWNNSCAFRQNYVHAHISVRRVQQIIANASEQSIGRKIHPHVLRHTFGTKLMRITNTRVVQQLLGHSSLATTQIYTHPNQDDLTEAINGL